MRKWVFTIYLGSPPRRSPIKSMIKLPISALPPKAKATQHRPDFPLAWAELAPVGRDSVPVDKAGFHLDW
jgi:hypothetical protein